MKPTHTLTGGCLLLATLLLGNPSLHAQPASLAVNPTFADSNGDGLPDGWVPFPAYDGIGIAPSGGVRINDQSSSQGLGVAQWLPATEGTRYRATVDATGTGGLFIYMIFTSRIPAKDGEISKVKLSETREWASAKKSPVTVNAIAPAGTRHVRLWIYSPNPNMADVTISSFKLEDLGQAELPAAAPVASTTLVSGKPPGPIPQGNLLQNPTFADADADGIPDNWSLFPSGDDSLRKIASASGGGLLFKDQDKNNGLGLEQWVPVEAGLRYTASATAAGSGAVNLALIFVSEKPARASDIDKVKLSDKSLYISATKNVPVIAVAPSGANWAKVWIYCPKIGLADLHIPQVTLTAEKDTNVIPSGLHQVMDFETGNFSQAHGTEGATVKVITAAEGPVREGKYAFKAAVRKDQHRAEVVGMRPPPYGVVRYGWSLYLPDEFDDKTQFSIITQWHDYGTGRQSPPDGGPPTSISVHKGKVSLKINYQGDDGWTTKGQYLPVGDVSELRGRWSDWVLEANWQPPGKGGWLKLHLNGRVVVDYQGTTFYEEKDKGRYFKFGIYKGGGTWKGEEAGAVLYFDNLRMAIGEESTYQMVDPKTYAPKPVRE